MSSKTNRRSKTTMDISQAINAGQIETAMESRKFREGRSRVRKMLIKASRARRFIKQLNQQGVVSGHEMMKAGIQFSH